MHHKTLLAAALLAASVTVSAAQVDVYGRIDTGLVFQHFSGDSTADDTFTLDSGPNTASRIGIRGTETITDDLSVGFRMENRFNSDAGSLREGGRLFGGHAAVHVTSKKYGELSFGRMAGIGSGSGPYDLLIYIDALDGGSVGTGMTSVRSTRYDNMITYRSPMLAGFQATIQHSLQTDSSGEGEESTDEVNRFYSAGLRFNRGPLDVVAYYEGMTWGHVDQPDNGADTNRRVFTLGTGYQLFDDVRLYAEAQYFDGVNSLEGFTAKTKDSSISGYGLYAGTQIWWGLSSWQTMVYWKDYKLESSAGEPSYDGETIALATKLFYRPSKTIDMYVGGGISQWDRVENGEILTDRGFNLFTGITKYF